MSLMSMSAYARQTDEDMSVPIEQTLAKLQWCPFCGFRGFMSFTGLCWHCHDRMVFCPKCRNVICLKSHEVRLVQRFKDKRRKPLKETFNKWRYEDW